MYLVTGATGVIGRPLMDTLLASGAQVRAVTRQSNVSLPQGAHAVTVDDLDCALQGVDSLFVHPRATKDDIASLLAHAAEHRVGRVVVMSAINADDDVSLQPSWFNGDRNTEVERAVVNSGLPWVSVRPSSFAMNTLTMWSGQVANGDMVFGPFAEFAEPLIHEWDVADVIARAMVDDALLGRTIPITGPEALRMDQLVAIIGETLDRPLGFQEVPSEMAAKGMIAHGLDKRFVDALMARYAREIKQPLTVTSNVEDILGRPALPFATWVADHKDDWS
ncbi:SDR family oxidoreductase [Nocardia sp. NPDC050412]|uniref:SDR family oxidoreductase n=1 Tax=Nocardia sp. NPDC050412 TaxID=3364320 RepID=UPI00378EBDAE